MKAQLIVAGVAVAAAGALGLSISEADHTSQHDVALTTSGASLNDMLLHAEGVTAWQDPGTPLGEIAGTSGTNFYDVITSGSTASGSFVPTDNTVAAQDLLNSTLITGANQALGLGYTNGYVGLSPTSTADVFTFMDQEAVSYDQGLQALMTAFNQPLISYESGLSAVNPALGDPSLLNLDPAQLGTDPSALTLTNDLTVAYQDFVNFFDYAAGMAPMFTSIG